MGYKCNAVTFGNGDNVSNTEISVADRSNQAKFLSVDLFKPIVWFCSPASSAQGIDVIGSPGMLGHPCLILTAFGFLIRNRGHILARHVPNTGCAGD